MSNSETTFSPRLFGIVSKPVSAIDQRDPPRVLPEDVGEEIYVKSTHGSSVGTSATGGTAEDESLLERICRGDRDSLALLFRRYARMLHTVARRILRDASEADDLVQEVFLFVFRRAALFDPARGSVRCWLVQVAWHRAIDRRRYLEARHFYTCAELEDDLLEAEGSCSRPISYEESIEGSLGRETLRRIDEALSEDQRQVIHLYFFEGRTILEIAALLGQTPGNVRNHYYRALEKMRREIFPAKLRKK